MTDSAPEAKPDDVSQEEIVAAEAAEQAELTKAQNRHLTQRVVVLRVQVNRLERAKNLALMRLAELEEKLAQYEPAEEPEPEDTPESDPENSPEG